MEARFELHKVLNSEVASIMAARDKCRLIHGASDIKAAGDEVEETIRKILRCKLPASYHLGHGHVVDNRWFSSPQYDIILSNGASLPPLFRAENGTEFFAHETVFAVGEIKSTYRCDQNYIGKFIESCGKLRKLHRQKVDERGHMYKNPLLTFMLFVDSGHFQANHVEGIFLNTPAEELPNIVCFLDKGLIMNVRFSLNDLGEKIPVHVNTIPEFNTSTDGQSNHWAFLNFSKEQDKLGGNWGYLYYLILGHLDFCKLASPNIHTYPLKLFLLPEGLIFEPSGDSGSTPSNKNVRSSQFIRGKAGSFSGSHRAADPDVACILT
jgi:hypothetical protein